MRDPDNPKLAELGRWMFLAEDSPWHPVHALARHCYPADLFTSPLVGVPAFRGMLKRALSDRSPIGTVRFDGFGFSRNLEIGAVWFRPEYGPDAKLPKSGEERPLRTCDEYATQLSGLEGSPRFES